VIWQSLKRKRRNNELLAAQKAEILQKNEELQTQNRKIESQRDEILAQRDEIEAQKTQLADANSRITASIRYAHRIQTASVPSEEMMHKIFGECMVYWKPLNIVSGDFYWATQAGRYKLLTAADCTGHGVPGAFMSMLGVAFLNEICAKIDESVQPSDVLEQLRSLVITTLKQKNEDILEPKDGMDMALCTLILKTRVLRFSGANNPMYLVRAGELTEYRPVKNPIGLYPRLLQFETTEIQTQPGDYVYMFSDGYADQFGGEVGKKMSYKRFKGILTDICKRTSIASEQEKLIADYLDEWRAEFMQMDDVLVGGYKM
jgi:serine phosphatase RsbU (regulator of sigma subunit)